MMITVVKDGHNAIIFKQVMLTPDELNVLDHLMISPSSVKMLLSWALCVSVLLLTPASGTTLCMVQNGAANTNIQSSKHECYFNLCLHTFLSAYNLGFPLFLKIFESPHNLKK